jgi:hypothetical protein
VFADLSNGVRFDGCPVMYPAVKVMPAPLERVPGKTFRLGDRVPTVSTYLSGDGGHHSDFFPIPAVCATDDREAIDRLMKALEAENEGWDALAVALDSVPQPYLPGIYQASPFLPVSAAGQAARQNEVALAGQNAVAEDARRRKWRKGAFGLGGALLILGLGGLLPQYLPTAGIFLIVLATVRQSLLDQLVHFSFGRIHAAPDITPTIVIKVALPDGSSKE